MLFKSSGYIGNAEARRDGRALSRARVRLKFSERALPRFTTRKRAAFLLERARAHPNTPACARVLKLRRSAWKAFEIEFETISLVEVVDIFILRCLGHWFVLIHASKFL